MGHQEQSAPLEGGEIILHELVRDVLDELAAPDEVEITTWVVGAKREVMLLNQRVMRWQPIHSICLTSQTLEEMHSLSRSASNVED